MKIAYNLEWMEKEIKPIFEGRREYHRSKRKGLNIDWGLWVDIWTKKKKAASLHKIAQNFSKALLIPIECQEKHVLHQAKWRNLFPSNYLTTSGYHLYQNSTQNMPRTQSQYNCNTAILKYTFINMLGSHSSSLPSAFFTWIQQLQPLAINHAILLHAISVIILKGWICIKKSIF